MGRRRGGQARPAVRRGEVRPTGEVAVRVNVIGHPISAEALATLPPREGGDFSGERSVWEGKFFTS